MVGVYNLIHLNSSSSSSQAKAVSYCLPDASRVDISHEIRSTAADVFFPGIPALLCICTNVVICGIIAER